MFEREARKEKNLEQIKKQQEQAKKLIPKENTSAKQKWEAKKQELIGEVEQQFTVLLKKEEEIRMKEENKQLDTPQQFKKKGLTDDPKKYNIIYNNQEIIRR